MYALSNPTPQGWLYGPLSPWMGYSIVELSTHGCLQSLILCFDSKGVIVVHTLDGFGQGTSKRHKKSAPKCAFLGLCC